MPLVPKDILGIIPNDFTDDETPKLCLNQLIANFKTISLDFMDPMQMDKKSKSLEFCSKIIYEVGLETRNKNSESNVSYTFNFVYPSENGEEDVKTAFVIVTGTNHRSETFDDYFIPGRKIYLSLKTAGILAVLVLNQLCATLNLSTPTVCLSVLASAYFSETNIVNIAKEIRQSNVEVMGQINTSCQPGGEYIEYSKLHIALCAVVVATINIADDKLRIGLIAKVLNAYYKVNKQLDIVMFKVYAKYLRVRLPDSFNIESLILKCKTAPNLSDAELAEACNLTQVTAIVKQRN